MEEMKPFVRIRLRHPKEVALHFLDGILFQVGQNKEQLVSHRGEGRGVRRTVAAAGAGLSINGVVCHIGQKGVFEMREEGCEFWYGQAGHGP